MPPIACKTRAEREREPGNKAVAAGMSNVDMWTRTMDARSTQQGLEQGYDMGGCT